MKRKLFQYGELETAHLSERDPKLGAAIKRIGFLENEVIPDLFTAICFNIISQQVAYKAALTVWQRFCAELAKAGLAKAELTKASSDDLATDPDNNTNIVIQPAAVLTLNQEILQALGLSWRKVSYIRGIAEMFVDGTINPVQLINLPDDEIRQQLIKLPGIGNWTVDMLLMFSLERPDVISWHDLALRRGLMRLHQLSAEDLNRDKYESYRRLYSPYGTIASFYLWHIAHEK
jgi:DNA-3-methyladenine glycosylase II